MSTKITLPLVLAAGSLVNAASAFSSVAPAPTSTASILENLRSSPLIRASDSAPVVLPDQWRSSTPFGIGDETAAVPFLRPGALPHASPEPACDPRALPPQCPDHA